MAKNMAKIENGVVVNIEWYSDGQEETEAIRNIAERPIAIGDTYAVGKFYRDGVEVLTEIERLRMENEDMRNALKTMGVNADD